MPLSLLNHSALALFAQRTRIPTSARSIGFCAIWVCISSNMPSQPSLPCLLSSYHFGHLFLTARCHGPSSLWWPLFSDTYDSGAAPAAYWLGSTLSDE